MSEATPRDQLDALLNLDFSDLDDREAIRAVGHIVDFAGDLHDTDAVGRALTRITEVRARGLSEQHQTLLHYFEGNAWSVKTVLRSMSAPSDAWAWEADDLAGKTLAYRRAVGSSGFNELAVYQRCQVLTNLGSSLSNVGRFVEALDLWDRALALDEGFGMAIAKKGHALFSYLHSLYDEGHRAVFAKVCHALLVAAMQRRLEADTATKFQETLDALRREAPQGFFDENLNLGAFDLGRTKRERAYRSWCLDKRLFVNPLSDVLPESVAAADVLNLPTLHGRIEEMGTSRGWIGLYNVLKQEFVAARTLLWEGLTDEGSHFADRDLNLMDTLDGSQFGMALEKVKLAFRSAYSILDRIGFLLNSYFKLGIPAHQVQFRTLWYRNRQKAQGLRPEFVDRKNWPLRGLFWLSKDLDGTEVGIQECLEPEARAIQDLRNHLEHKYAKVVNDLAVDELSFVPDGLCLRITASDLSRKALHTVKLTRAALIYTSLTIHAEERKRRQEAGEPDESKTLMISTPRTRR